jgi:hypothetical protein
VDKRKAWPIPQTPAEITTQHHRDTKSKAYFTSFNRSA